MDTQNWDFDIRTSRLDFFRLDFFWGKIFERFAYRKSRSRAREIVEKLPWRAFNPGFWVERFVPRGCKGRYSYSEICGWDIIARHSLSRMESVDIVQTRVCSSCKILTSDRAFHIYVPYPREISQREAVKRKWRVLLTDLWEIRDKNKSTRIDRYWNNPSHFASPFIMFRRESCTFDVD